MTKIKMTSGKFTFVARLEEEKSPKTTKWLLEKLPWKIDIIHVSWSGSACFAPIGDQAFDVPFESPIRIPSKGEIIVYPGNVDGLQWDGEFFISWGPCSIATQNGNLMGNHVLTIVEGNENLEEYGRIVHLQGMQPMTVELA